MHACARRYVFDAVSALGGFWVKLAQGASVISIFPEPFSHELSRLQDAMPPDPIAAIHQILREELGPRWRDTVLSIEPTPLGSATVAQVHRATLRIDGGGHMGGGGAAAPNGAAGGGRAFGNGGGGMSSGGGGGSGGGASSGSPARTVDAVIKIQHPHVRDRLEIDIIASTLLATLLGYLAPMLFRDFPSIIRDLATLTRAELDFRIEASNQQLAQATIQAAGLARVRVPTVFPSLVTTRLLAME